MDRRAAVLGRPVGHSLSPVLHRAAYAALGLTGWRYDAVDCGEDELPGLVRGLGPEWAGLSLTMPLKRAALAAADEVSPLAAAVGAANTLLLGARTVAHNTDVAGIAAALGEAAALREAGALGEAAALGEAGAGGVGGRVVVLGAGGTAQAALAALRERGVPDPVVLVRDPARAGELRAAARRLGVAPEVRGGLPDAPLPPADLLVSTLPAGAADAVRVERWVPGAVLLDVVYAPWPTPLAAAAAAGGARVVGGLAVLLHQAAAQVELMTGRPAPVDRMRAALDAAVRARPA